MSEPEIEVVGAPTGRVERAARANVIYEAALEAAKTGKGVKLRFDSYRERDGYVAAVQRRARCDNYRANSQAGTNNSVTIWIDLTPYPRKGSTR